MKLLRYGASELAPPDGDKAPARRQSLVKKTIGTIHEPTTA